MPTSILGSVAAMSAVITLSIEYVFWTADLAVLPQPWRKSVPWQDDEILTPASAKELAYIQLCNLARDSYGGDGWYHNRYSQQIYYIPNRKEMPKYVTVRQCMSEPNSNVTAHYQEWTFEVVPLYDEGTYTTYVLKPADL